MSILLLYLTYRVSNSTKNPMYTDQRGKMKITDIETFIVDAGWRPWIFVKMMTNEGITGYGECSDGRSPQGVKGTIEDLKPLLIGQDPRAYEMRFWDMIRGTRQSPGGIAAKAIAGLECALVDI